MDIDSAKAFGIDPLIQFIEGYCTAGLDTIPYATPTIDDIHYHDMKAVFHDCALFYLATREELHLTGTSYFQLGTQFFLARNGYKEGFLDHEYPQDIAKKLHRTALAYRSAVFSIGDDKLVHYQ